MASQADPTKDLAQVEGKISTIKNAILNGVDSRLFVDELKQLQASHADSDDRAQAFRFDAAQRSDLIARS